MMTVKAVRRVNTKKTGTKVYRYYICSNATKRGWKNCPHPSLSAPELESYIVSELERISGDAMKTMMIFVTDANPTKILEE